MHKSQILLILALAYIVGITIASWRVMSERELLLLSIIALLIMSVSVYRRTFGDSARGLRRRILGFILGCALLALLGGMFRYGYVQSAHGLLAQFADRQAGNRSVATVMQGYIDGDPSGAQERSSVSFLVTEIIASPKLLFTHERILLTAPEASQFSYGTLLQLEGTPQTPKAISDFDYAAYLRKDGITYILNNPVISPIDSLHNITWRDRVRLAVMRPILQARNRFIISLQKAVPEPAASYLAGVLLGIRTQLPETIREAFNRTSTSHILAISGYNIAVVGQLAMAVLLLALYRRQAFWVTIVMIGCFTLMTGASASVLRAAIMGILVLAASSYGRLYDGATSVITAAAGMLLVNPLLLKSDIGFQLSFVATLGMMLLYEPIERSIRRWPMHESLRPILATTASAQIAVLPLLAYHFGTISLIALPVNLIVLPFVPVVMLVGFLTGIAGLLVPFLAKVIGVIAWAISMYQLTAVQWAARFPWAAIDVHVPLLVVMLLYGVLGWSLWRYRYAR